MNVDILIEPLRVLLRLAGEFLPRLALAGLVIILGWLLAKAVRLAVNRGLRAINFNVLTQRAGIDGFLEQGGIGLDTTAIVAALVYWIAILATLVIAFNGLGLTYITDLLGKVVLFVPKIIVALFVLTFGAYFAHFIGNSVVAYCRNIGVADAELLGRIARYALIGFVVLIALDLTNVGGDIVRESFLILLAGVVFALSLAFGLGGRRWAARLLDRWWPPDGGNDKPQKPAAR
jgi:flagellar biosynthesis protein FliQ